MKSILIHKQIDASPIEKKAAFERFCFEQEQYRINGKIKDLAHSTYQDKSETIWLMEADLWGEFEKKYRE